MITHLPVTIPSRRVYASAGYPFYWRLELTPTPGANG